MKQTKEQLLVEVTKIRQSHAEWVSGDERKRKEFAKAFNWYEKTNTYGYSSEKTTVKLPSWEEIFVELGKLLEKEKRLNYISDMETFKLRMNETEINLKNLENQIKKEIHPNL